MKRWYRYQLLKLMRTHGGAAGAAKGFSVGLAVEMFTLPTGGLAFLLLFPLLYLVRGRMSAALVGFVIGKLIYIPMAVLNERVGHWLLPSNFIIQVESFPQWLNHLMTINVHLIVGGIIDGCILGFLFYLPVKNLLIHMQARRRERRREKRMAYTGE